MHPQQKLKIFNSKLPSGYPFVECDIDEKTTFADVIVKSVQLFELQVLILKMYNYKLYQCIYTLLRISPLPITVFMKTRLGHVKGWLK